MKKYCLTILPFVLSSVLCAQNFKATPLTDFSPGELYLNTFPGFLYEGSNTMPADHDADGRNAANRIQPLDTFGNPSPSGKIVAIGIGMSNWTDELCESHAQCTSASFLGETKSDPQVNHKTLVIVDCAKPGQVADRWLDDHFLNYSYCKSQLQRAGATEAQVQIVLYKNALENPTQSLKPGTVCNAQSAVEACHYEHEVGITARYIKSRYLNVQQMFVHSRIYAGYAKPHTLDPEPYAYEYGFATKWLIEAQIQQVRTGVVDDTAGPLSYSDAPWIAWGPYFWASGPIPRKDGLTWLPQDYSLSDMTHPGPGAVLKVAGMMLDFYLKSPYAPWFVAGGN